LWIALRGPPCKLGLPEISRPDLGLIRIDEGKFIQGGIRNAKNRFKVNIRALRILQGVCFKEMCNENE